MKIDFSKILAYLSHADFHRFLRVRHWLLASNVVLVFTLILLFNLDLLPFKNIGHFLFFAVIFFLLAMYRPGWVFLLFCGTSALEIINVAPAESGFNLRPYQFLGFLLTVAIIFRLVSGRINFALPSWNWVDLAATIFVTGGFFSFFATGGGAEPFKQTLVAASFLIWYFLARVFVSSFADIKKILPFFLSSGAIVASYAIWQNLRFTRGLSHFEIMPGRPNSVFTEPDWLGIYLALLSTVVYSVLYYYFSQKGSNNETKKFNSRNSAFKKTGDARHSSSLIIWLLFLVLIYISLILTVSRSAWLGAGIGFFLFLLLPLIKERSLELFLKNGFFVLGAFLTAVFVIYFFNLTNFQIFDRVQSAKSGWQKITVSCRDDRVLPEKITSSEELFQYDCRHINLEEIKIERARGYFVHEIYRDDPSIGIRAGIYHVAWETAWRSPFWGIGWGNIEKILGQGAQGEKFNASNIFLESWLGAGLTGLIAFLAIWLYILKKGVFFFHQITAKEKKVFAFFLLAGSASLLVSNFFNAGIFMGVLWLFFGISPADKKVAIS